MNRRIIASLATVLAAGAVAVGSGATFSSQTGNTISSVTAGTLQHTNSKDKAAIFKLDNMKPGDTVTGELTLTNTGSLPATFSLVESESTNGFGGTAGGNLSLKIVDMATPATPVYDGAFGGLVDGAATNLGTWQPNDSHTYQFTVTLAESAPNADQGKTAGALYTWSSVQ